MQLQTAQRKRAKIRLGLQGPSGSGKTFSALQVAYGLCGDWSRIAVVDSEHGSSHLYSHLGPYHVLELSEPHSPERYADAISICEKVADVVILDSITHEWEYLLDVHGSMTGNSFTNWSKITPRHQAFVQRILRSSSHVICCIRTKTEYTLTEKNGRVVPEKVGLKGVQRDGIDYELSIMFDLDIKNMATASKDRTGLFFGKPEQKLSVQTGQQILDWCNSGAEITVDYISQRIGDITSIQELLRLYEQYPQFQQTLKPEFEQQKRRIIVNREVTKQLADEPVSLNGKHD
jgi:hypothetical protein